MEGGWTVLLQNYLQARAAGEWRYHRVARFTSSKHIRRLDVLRRSSPGPTALLDLHCEFRFRSAIVARFMRLTPVRVQSDL